MAVLKRYNDTTSEWEPVVVGKRGPSGVVDVTAPITNSGTDTNAVIGIDETAIEITASQISDLTATASALNTIDDGTLGFTALSNGTAGITYQPISPNYIINGAFDIWQRGTSFTGAAARQYFADRFVVGGSTVNTITQQTDAPANFTYSAKFQRTAGSTDTTTMDVTHNFETAGKELAGKSVTLSFYAKAGANYSASSLTVQIRSTSRTPSSVTYFGNGIMRSDNPDYSTNLNSSIVPTTSWVRYSFTFTASALANGFQIVLQNPPVGTAGADDSYYITGVQLEAGSVATPFRRNANSIQGELAACQRYFQRWGGQNKDSQYSTGFCLISTRAQTSTYLPVQMRATPSISLGSAVTFGNVTATQTPTLVSNRSSTQVVSLYLGVAGVTAKDPAYLYDDSVNSYFDASAEL